MATTGKKQPQVLFFKIAFSLLKLANSIVATHGDDTHCTCVFCLPWKQKMASGTFPYTNYFLTSQTCKPCNTWRWNLVRMCFSAFPLWPAINKNGSLLLLLHYSTCKQCMKVKLGTHVHFSISMTTINKNWPEALFCITIFTTTSLVKLATRITHEGETW